MDHPMLITLKTLEPQFKNISVITINKPVFTIGRSLENYAIIPHLGISRRHCILKKNKNSEWTLRDISSGIVTINGSPVEKNIDHPLSDEDVIKFDVVGVFAYVFEWKPKDNQEKTFEENEHSLKKLANDNVDLEKKLEEVEKNKSIEVSLNGEKSSEKNQGDSTIEKMSMQYNELIETELQCTICSEPYYKAVLLNCGHTFCEFCINQWIKRKKECPTCRSKVNQRSRNLTIDSIIENMIEKLDQESQNRRKELIQSRNVTVSRKRKEIKSVVNENSQVNRRASLRRRTTANETRTND